MGSPEDRLWVSYFGGDPKARLGPDLESRDVWLNRVSPPPTYVPLLEHKKNWKITNTGPQSLSVSCDTVGSAMFLLLLSLMEGLSWQIAGWCGESASAFVSHYPSGFLLRVPASRVLSFGPGGELLGDGGCWRYWALH